MFTTLKFGKDLVYPKMSKNLKILAVSRKKVFVPEIKLKMFEI